MSCNLINFTEMLLNIKQSPTSAHSLKMNIMAGNLLILAVSQDEMIALSLHFLEFFLKQQLLWGHVRFLFLFYLPHIHFHSFFRGVERIRISSPPQSTTLNRPLPPPPFPSAVPKSVEVHVHNGTVLPYIMNVGK
jgi:hypothetical protein